MAYSFLPKPDSPQLSEMVHARYQTLTNYKPFIFNGVIPDTLGTGSRRKNCASKMMHFVAHLASAARGYAKPILKMNGIGFHIHVHVEDVQRLVSPTKLLITSFLV